jgi:hypothetical protein
MPIMLDALGDVDDDMVIDGSIDIELDPTSMVAVVSRNSAKVVASDKYWHQMRS